MTVNEDGIEKKILCRFQASRNLQWNRPTDGYRQAAVLVPLVWSGDQWNLLFTRRTDTVQDHKGQVSFPGGASDPEDYSPEGTALRETYEEIGILPGDIKILGKMNSMLTITHYEITPIIGKIPWPYHLKISEVEVVRAFTIPYKWLANARHYEVRQIDLGDNPNVPVIYFEEYEGELLWGISAQIVVNMIEILSR